MNRLGIQSLNAGAPDLRLSGDQTQRGTYTQRRRNQMAYGGIAGLDGRMKYGIGSWFQDAKDKLIDDLIPNEIKENPLLTAALVGGSTKFLPEGMGQGWLGDLLGKAEGVPYLGPIATGMQNVGTGITNLANMIPGVNLPGGTEYSTTRPSGMDVGYSLEDLISGGGIGGASVENILASEDIGAKDSIANLVKQQLLEKAKQEIIPGYTSPTRTSTGQEIRWKEPLAIGTAIGAADHLTRSDDKMPAQLAIDPSRFATAAAAKADPNLRFKPQEQYTLKDGGRIGYGLGNLVTDFDEASPVQEDIRVTIKQIAEQSASPESFPATDSDFAALAQLSNKPEHFPSTDYDFDVILRIAKEINVTAPEQSKAETYANYMAQGGRIGYNGGGLTDYQLFKLKELGYGKAGSNPGSYGGIGVLKDILKLHKYADGGRIGYADKGFVDKIPKVDTENILKNLEDLRKKKKKYDDAIFASERIDAQEGGLMNLGGMEKDYRQEGGFVPIGGREKADDVPARLSKNEFVFTADAVRAAGGGDIDAGAEVMENLMENLEAGGKVSEASQGLEGAQEMFANAQQLEKRII